MNRARYPKRLAYRAALGALLFAVLLSYVLVMVHSSHEHEAAKPGDKCVVCSWLQDLATGCAPQLTIAVVLAAGQVILPLLLISCPSRPRLPVSARAPPSGCAT
jgi:hypothetical protein